MSHSITKCRICEAIITQCRCGAKDKTVNWDYCHSCKGLPFITIGDDRNAVINKLSLDNFIDRLNKLRDTMFDRKEKAMDIDQSESHGMDRDEAFKLIMDTLPPSINQVLLIKQSKTTRK